MGVAVAIVGSLATTVRSVAAIVRSVRREGGASMVGSMVGSMAVAVVGGGLLEKFGVGLEYLHVLEVSMCCTKVLKFWWGYHTKLS